jgi:hypothetical protein
LVSTIKTRRNCQCLVGANIGALHAQNTLGGKNALSVLDVIGDSDIHRAYSIACPAIVAFLRIATDLQQGDMTRHLDNGCDGAHIFAERAIVMKKKG